MQVKRIAECSNGSILQYFRLSLSYYLPLRPLLSPRFFKKASGILQSPPSVRLSCYLLLNHWTKSNQIWCVSWSHKWGVQRHIFLGPAPWGGAKRSNIIKFQLQSQFQRFFNQTLCVFSHMKDIKHIGWDFSFGRLGHALGVGLRVLWGAWGVKFFFSEIQPDLVCELLTCMAHAPAPFFGTPPPGALGRGQKAKYH